MEEFEKMPRRTKLFYIASELCEMKESCREDIQILLAMYIVDLLEIETSLFIKIFHSFVVVFGGRQPACILRLAMKKFLFNSFCSAFKQVDYKSGVRL